MRKGKLQVGDRSSEGALGGVTVRVTLGEKITVAGLGDYEKAAPGKFCSEKLQKGQLSEVCPFPGGTPILPTPTHTPLLIAPQATWLRLKWIF